MNQTFKTIIRTILLITAFNSICNAEGQYGRLHTQGNLFLWQGKDSVYYMTSWCEEVPSYYKLQCNIKSEVNSTQISSGGYFNYGTQATETFVYNRRGAGLSRHSSDQSQRDAEQKLREAEQRLNEAEHKLRSAEQNHQYGKHSQQQAYLKELKTVKSLRIAEQTQRTVVQRHQQTAQKVRHIEQSTQRASHSRQQIKQKIRQTSQNPNDNEQKIHHTVHGRHDSQNSVVQFGGK